MEKHIKSLTENSAQRQPTLMPRRQQAISITTAFMPFYHIEYKTCNLIECKLNVYALSRAGFKFQAKYKAEIYVAQSFILQQSVTTASVSLRS